MNTILAQMDLKTILAQMDLKPILGFGPIFMKLGFKVRPFQQVEVEIMPNVASNEQNQCFTVAVGAQLTISNCLTRPKVYEMQSVDETNPTGQAVFGDWAEGKPDRLHFHIAN